MSVTGSIQSTITGAGVAIQMNVSRTGSAGIGISEDLPIAQAGFLTTRTSGTQGSATLGTLHGITTGQKVDVYWPAGATYVAGCRYGVVVGTVNDLVVPLTDSGAGDQYPAGLAAGAITVAPTVDMAIAVDCDDLVLIACGCDKRGHADLQATADESILALNLAERESWVWAADNGVANPIAGHDMVKVVASNGDATAAGTFKLVAVYDATP
jgi:hypothetical protein